MKSSTKLMDVVQNLSSFDPELTIYVVKPWTCDSDALVAREVDGGGIPLEAKSSGATYFIEVAVAKDFLDGWASTERRVVTTRERCERLIHYAVYDA